MDTKTEREEFLRLIQQNKGIIIKICHSYCHNRNDRDDLGQEIIYQLWKSGNKFNPDHRFSTWMYRIALNVAITFYRKEQKSTPIIFLPEEEIDMEDKPDGTGELEENIRLLQKFIRELKELDRALILLHLESKNYKEIAEILGITETNVGTRISRVKELLKQKFSNFKS